MEMTDENFDRVVRSYFTALSGMDDTAPHRQQQEVPDGYASTEVYDVQGQ